MNGRKRHLLVDTGGFLLKVVVHPADVQDRDGGLLVLADILTACPELRHLWVDAGYRGRFVDWVEAKLAWSVSVVKHWWTGVRAAGDPGRLPRGAAPLGGGADNCLVGPVPALEQGL